MSTSENNIKTEVKAAKVEFNVSRDKVKELKAKFESTKSELKSAKEEFNASRDKVKELKAKMK